MKKSEIIQAIIDAPHVQEIIKTELKTKRISPGGDGLPDFTKSVYFRVSLLINAPVRDVAKLLKRANEKEMKIFTGETPMKVTVVPGMSF